MSASTASRAALFTMLGLFTSKCDSHLRWTTDGTNGPLGLHGTTTTDGPEWNNCDNGTAVTTSGNWTIKMLEAGESTSNDVDDATTSNVTISVPAGGYVADDVMGIPGCTMTWGATTMSATYTDNATTVSINTRGIPFTASGCGGLVPASGTESYRATYTLDMALLVT